MVCSHSKPGSALWGGGPSIRHESIKPTCPQAEWVGYMGEGYRGAGKRKGWRGSAREPRTTKWPAGSQTQGMGSLGGGRGVPEMGEE